MSQIRTVAAMAAALFIAGIVGAAAHADVAAGDIDGYVRVPGPGHLPAPVADSFYAAYPNARIIHIEKKEHGNDIAYELRSIGGDVHRDILYHPNGTPIRIDETLPSSQLPGKIAKALKKHAPEWAVFRADKVIRPDSTRFDIIVKNADRNLELVLNPAGKVLSRREVADYSAVAKQ